MPDQNLSSTVVIDHAVPEPAHAFAAQSAVCWFPNTVVREGECTVFVSEADFRNARVREKLRALAGNTPGLVDAIIDCLALLDLSRERLPRLQVTLRAVPDAPHGDNHPLHAATRLRNLIG